MARVEDGEAWARKLYRLLLFALVLKRYHDGVIPAEKQLRLMSLYDKLVAQGLAYHDSLPVYKIKPGRGQTARRKGHNLVLRLQNFKDDVLRFITVPAVPFTNNQAEQDIRMMKVKQKISSGFRTLAGAQIFVRIRSFISTLRKQSIDIFTSITNALQGNLPQFV